MSFRNVRSEAFPRDLWVVACDREGCLAAVMAGGNTEEEQKCFSRELAHREGWQVGTAEVPVDLCRSHIVVEKKYTRLFDDDGYPLNKLLPRVDSNGRPLRSKKP